jgi:hypothetical protein
MIKSRRIQAAEATATRYMREAHLATERAVSTLTAVYGEQRAREHALRIMDKALSGQTPHQRRR